MVRTRQMLCLRQLAASNDFVERAIWRQCALVERERSRLERFGIKVCAELLHLVDQREQSELSLDSP